MPRVIISIVILPLSFNHPKLLRVLLFLLQTLLILFCTTLEVQLVNLSIVNATFVWSTISGQHQYVYLVLGNWYLHQYLKLQR